MIIYTNNMPVATLNILFSPGVASTNPFINISDNTALDK